MNTTLAHGLAVTLPELLDSLATKFPDRPALAAPGRTGLSYRALVAHIDCTQAALRECGLGHGDRIALVLPNGPEMAAAFLAIAGGAVCAPLNPHYRVEEFDFYLPDLAVKALIVEAGSDSAARAVATSRGIDVIELAPSNQAAAGIFSLHGAKRRAVATRPAQGEDIALLLHTSGTTSRPKLVPLLHRNLCASAFNVSRIGLADKLGEFLQPAPAPPRNEIEHAVANIVAEVLKTDNFGIDDNFFALGGDSLTGTQVANRIRAMFEIDLPNVAIFRKPTAAELAAEINEALASTGRAPMRNAIESGRDVALRNLEAARGLTGNRQRF